LAEGSLEHLRQTHGAQDLETIFVKVATSNV
jgi:hypothetical protein